MWQLHCRVKHENTWLVRAFAAGDVDVASDIWDRILQRNDDSHERTLQLDVAVRAAVLANHLRCLEFIFDSRPWPRVSRVSRELALHQAVYTAAKLNIPDVRVISLLIEKMAVDHQRQVLQFLVKHTVARMRLSARIHLCRKLAPPLDCILRLSQQVDIDTHGACEPLRHPGSNSCIRRLLRRVDARSRRDSEWRRRGTLLLLRRSRDTQRCLHPSDTCASLSTATE